MQIQLSAAAILKAEGGKWEKAIDDAIGIAAMDVRDRPEMGKARKITLEIEIAPLKDASGPGQCVWAAKVGSKIPPVLGGVQIAIADARGRITFEQGELPFEVPEGVESVELSSGGRTVRLQRKA
jgi:hypothetical protein